MENLIFIVIVCMICGIFMAKDIDSLTVETEPVGQKYELITDSAEQTIIRDEFGNLIYVSKEGKGVFVKRRHQKAEKLEVEYEN